MAKVSDETWIKAKALYEKGDSLREIEKATGIPYKTIDNRAKVKGWGKGILAQHISDAVRVKQEFGTMDLAQQAVVSKEVDERTKHIEFFSDAAVTNVRQAMKANCEGQNDYKARAETISKGRETVLGKSPDTAIQVNNNTITRIETVIVRPCAR